MIGWPTLQSSRRRPGRIINATFGAFTDFHLASIFLEFLWTSFTETSITSLSRRENLKHLAPSGRFRAILSQYLAMDLSPEPEVSAETMLADIQPESLQHVGHIPHPH